MADTLVDAYDIIDLLDRLVGYNIEMLAADAAGCVSPTPAANYGPSQHPTRTPN